MRAAEDYATIRDRMAELAKQREDNKCTCLYEHGILVAISAGCPIHPEASIGRTTDDVSGAVCGYPGYPSAMAMNREAFRRYLLAKLGYRLTGKRDG